MRVERKVPSRRTSGRWSSFPPRRRPDGLDLPAVTARSGAGSIHHVVERVRDALARGLALVDSVDLPREAAVRLAAVGDLHFGRDSEGALAPWLDQLAAEADLLVIAGDLTQNGDPKEAEVASRELQALPIPKVAVLGNHDYDYGQEQAVAERLEEGGVRVLEGDSVVVPVGGVRVGIAGVKGFGGGFLGACGSDFGEPEMKAFIAHTKSAARRLEEAIESLDREVDVKVALLHYAPVPGTLLGERPEIYPFLGSYLLAEPLDRLGVDLVLHGHAHAGVEKAMTPGGIPVRNVAQPVIRSAYRVYPVSRKPGSASGKGRNAPGQHPQRAISRRH